MNNIIPTQPAVGARDGNWMWDGTRWVCQPDCDDGSGFPNFRPPPPWFPPPATSPPWYPGGNAGVSFSPPGSPPPNPIRGNFWWDGSTLWMFDGAAWVPTGGASGGGTTPPSSTAPANPQPGQQWFNGTTLFVWDGHAWVPVSQTKTYVQATAPPAPNPGDMWYDGIQLRIWDGSAWQLVGPGATVGPVPTTTQTFRMVQSSNITVTPNTTMIVPFFDVPVIDTQGAWNAGNNTLTPKVAGVYIFEYATSLYGSQNIAFLAKNDSGVNSANMEWVSIGYVAGTALEATVLSLTGITTMNGTTDFVRAWVNCAGTMYVPGATPVLKAFLLP